MEKLEYIAHKDCFMKFLFLETEIYVYVCILITVWNVFPAIWLQHPPQGHLKLSWTFRLARGHTWQQST